MKLLLIHQAFVAPGEPGGTRHYEFARHLVKEGDDVTIISSNLSYLTGSPTNEGKGAVYEQKIEGIKVLRSYTCPLLHKSVLGRIASLSSFMITGVYAGLRSGPVDLVMGTSPSIFQATSAWLISRLKRRPLLLEIRDLWPSFVVEIGLLRNRVLIKLARWLEFFLYGQAKHILVNSPAYKEYLIKHGVSGAKITLIPNGVDVSVFDPQKDGSAFRIKYGIEGRFIVTYAGALGIANNIQTILKAAYRLKDNRKIVFLLAGDGIERKHLEQLAQNLKLKNVLFLGAIPKNEVPELLAASDICIATLKNIPMFKTTYPNKVFDYMAAGRPTIICIDGVIRQVIEAAKGGVFVSPEDDKGLAAELNKLLYDRNRIHEMGLNARAYVEANFNRKMHIIAFKKLVDHLTTLNL